MFEAIDTYLSRSKINKDKYSKLFKAWQIVNNLVLSVSLAILPFTIGLMTLSLVHALIVIPCTIGIEIVLIILVSISSSIMNNYGKLNLLSDHWVEHIKKYSDYYIEYEEYHLDFKLYLREANLCLESGYYSDKMSKLLP